MHRFHYHSHGGDREHRGRHAFGPIRGMRGPGRHGRAERVFEQGDLRLLLLKLIAEKPSHGYELIKAIEEAVGGAYSPSPGVVYPTLSLLQDQGYAKVEAAEGGKKLYAVTADGSAFLETQAGAIALLMARMEEAAVAGRGRNAPQIRRAMGNLGMALQIRLSRGPLSEDQVQAVAAAIDAAAQAIERA